MWFLLPNTPIEMGEKHFILPIKGFCIALVNECLSIEKSVVWKLCTALFIFKAILVYCSLSDRLGYFSFPLMCYPVLLIFLFWFLFIKCFKRIAITQSFILLWIGWLGWINSWRETTASVSVGNWAINNIPDVSIIISAQTETSMASWHLIFAWYAFISMWLFLL